MAFETELTKPRDVEVSDLTSDEKATVAIKFDKEWRVELDDCLQRMKANHLIRTSRERSLAMTKLEECIMWLGMDLKAIGTPNPYPNSYKPENSIVDPTADGLKL